MYLLVDPHTKRYLSTFEMFHPDSVMADWHWHTDRALQIENLTFAKSLAKFLKVEVTEL